MRAKGVVVGVSDPNNLRRRHTFSVLRDRHYHPFFALPKLERALIRSSSVPINRKRCGRATCWPSPIPCNREPRLVPETASDLSFRNSTRAIDLTPRTNDTHLLTVKWFSTCETPWTAFTTLATLRRSVALDTSPSSVTRSPSTTMWIVPPLTRV